MELSAAQKKDEAVRHDTAMLKSGRKRRMTDRFGFYVDGARVENRLVVVRQEYKCF